jgi:polar amino acid transport system substrate-binding protein
MSHRRARIAALLLVLSLLASACGSSDDGQDATASPAAPTAAARDVELVDDGTLTFCSDISSTGALERYEADKPVGAEVDLAAELAARLGVRWQMVNVGFDGLIAALQSKKCDGILSGMNDTAERRKQLDFVDYVNVGSRLMVRKGNPADIGSLADLAGKSVAVQVSTTEGELLAAENERLRAAGEPEIAIDTFPSDTAAVQALQTGKTDAWFSGTTGVGYFVAAQPGLFEPAGPQVEPAPYGIGLRKDTPRLRAALSRGVDELYRDGTMQRILDEWKLGSIGLPEQR